MRLLAGHSGGAADLERFSVAPDGTRILVNDTSNPNALLAFRAVKVTTRPVLNQPTLSGGLLTLSWTGSGTWKKPLLLTANINPPLIRQTRKPVRQRGHKSSIVF